MMNLCFVKDSVSLAGLDCGDLVIWLGVLWTNARLQSCGFLTKETRWAHVQVNMGRTLGWGSLPYRKGGPRWEIIMKASVSPAGDLPVWENVFYLLS